MSTVSIDGKEYDFDALPAHAKEQLQSLQFVNAELQRLAAQTAVFQTARTAYAKALREALINVPTPLGGDTIKLG